MMVQHLRRRAGRETGAALTVVMILLLVMTLLGLASTRSSLLQERMSGAMYDRALAFQAAEAALRAGEERASLRPTPAAGCSGGMCGFPNPAAAPVWTVAANWAAAPTVDIEGVAGEGQYLLEILADEVPIDINACTTAIDPNAGQCAGVAARYRITARSGGAGRAAVMIQSIYSTAAPG